MIPFFLVGQESIFQQETEKTTIYSSETSGGIGMHTNGFTGTFRYGLYTSGFTKRIYEIEVTNIKHPREVKSIYPFEDDVRGYIYGKLNSFYSIRPSIGFQKVFVPKQSIRGVSITYVAHIGPSIGLAKPVYLNIIEIEGATNNRIIVKRRFDPDIHNPGNIYGRASFLNGFSEMRLYPGIFGKFGFHFDYGSDRETLRSIEAGIMLDAYFQQIPILAFSENRAIYPNLYLAIFFGARKVK